MKTSARSIMFKTMIALVLSTGFVLQPALRTSTATATYPVADFKTESQIRSEASLYDAAIRAIAGVAQMKLEDPQELKKAIAILDQHQPNVRFNRSKLIALGLNDSTFQGAVKKRLANKSSTEALLKELSADPKTVLKWEGADTLAARINKSAETDAAILRQTGERLQKAAASYKQAKRGQELLDPQRADGMRVLQANYILPADSIEPTPFMDPASIAAIVFLVVVVAAVVIYTAAILKNVSTEPARDKVEDCLDAADDRLRRCKNDARDKPFPFDIAATAVCYELWAIKSGECLINP